jgi:transcriptional regulator with PAS, ATPase and Fis domain
MQDARETPVIGLLVLDGSGRPSHGTGLGTDPRVRSLAEDAGWLAEARARRLQPLVLDRAPYVLLVIDLSPGGTLILFSRPPGDALIDFLGSVDFAYDLFQYLVTDPFEAMTVVDAQARVAFISPVHERFFGLERGEAVGRPVRDVIENTRLDRVVRSGKAEIGEVQRMGGAERVVNRIPIRRGDKVVGAFGRVMFKGPEQVENLSRRVNALESEVAFYRREASLLRSRSYGLESIIGESRAMRRVRADIVKVAPLEIPVLIRGESGTGKELVAHALHKLSPRRDGPLVAVNAAALPASLVEAELFGYAPGAFTGADKKGRKGKFEQASGGTIFLDEIGDMPLEVQVKLLRVLQDRLVERIGAEQPVEVDFRLVSATNRDLQAMVGEKTFRLDLFYRVSPIILQVPPLRERIEDIPLLVETFLTELSRRHALPAPSVTDDALNWLADQTWPGNVRQLRHEIERAFVFAEGGLITAAALAGLTDDGSPVPQPSRPRRSAPEAAATLRDVRDRTENDLIRAAMLRLKGNKKRVAEELGISRSYLYKKLDEMALQPAEGP